ncbi:MAG: OmpH family outer membrane protein [Burkholderiales bacterium]|nr:OmpH family outer membrane protein [Burkholderiales bacterium]
MRYAAWLAGSVLVAVVSGTALAQSKIGFVNTERIFRESEAAKRAEKKLEGEFSRRERELNDLTNRLRTESERFQKDLPVMNETQRNQRQRALGDLELDVNRKQREFNEDVNRRRNEEFSTVLQAANRALKQIAEREGLDAVFQDAAYANPKLDLTDKVLKALADAK